MESKKSFNEVEYMKWMQEQLDSSTFKPKNLREDLHDCYHLLCLLENYGVLEEDFWPRESNQPLVRERSNANRDLLCKILNKFAKDLGQSATFNPKGLHIYNLFSLHHPVGLKYVNKILDLMKDNREQVLLLVQAIAESRKETFQDCFFGDASTTSPEEGSSRGRSPTTRGSKSPQQRKTHSGSWESSPVPITVHEADKTQMEEWEKNCIQKVKHMAMKKDIEAKNTRDEAQGYTIIQNLEKEAGAFANKLELSEKSIQETEESILQLNLLLEQKKKILVEQQEDKRRIQNDIQIKSEDIIRVKNDFGQKIAANALEINSLESLIKKFDDQMKLHASRMKHNKPEHLIQLQKDMQEKVERFWNTIIDHPRTHHRSPSNERINTHRSIGNYSGAVSNPSEQKKITPPKANYQAVLGQKMSAERKLENVNDIKILDPYFLPEKNLLEARHLSLNSSRDDQITQLPSSISLLTNLESLWLHSNQLSSLPLEITTLTNLTSLTLDNNMIEELPQWITRLANLEHLQINIGNSVNLKRIPETMKPMILNMSRADQYHLRKLPVYKCESSAPPFMDYSSPPERGDPPVPVQIRSNLKFHLRSNFPKIKKMILPDFVLDGNGLALVYGKNRVFDTEGIRKAVEYFASAQVRCVVAIPIVWNSMHGSKVRPYPLHDPGLIVHALGDAGIETVFINPTSPNDLAALANQRKAILISNYRPTNMNPQLANDMQGKIFPFRFVVDIEGNRKFDLHFRDETLTQFLNVLK